MRPALILTLLLAATPARAQLTLSLDPEVSVGYDSNLYYGAGALPDDATVLSGNIVGVRPSARLWWPINSANHLLMTYEGSLRQVLSQGVDHETLLNHGLLLSYLPPSLGGFQVLLAGGYSQLYLRELAAGGWRAGLGMVQFSRTFGAQLRASLGYVAEYSDYNSGSSASAEMSHRARGALAWQARPGLSLELEYGFAKTFSELKPPPPGPPPLTPTPQDYTSMTHLGGLRAKWQLPVVPVELSVGYSVMAYLLDNSTINNSPMGPRMGPGQGQGQGQGQGPGSGMQNPGEDRTDLLHWAQAEVLVKARPWLKVGIRWQSLWGSSNLADDYSRHQVSATLQFHWDVGLARQRISLPREVSQPDQRLRITYVAPAAQQVALVGTFNHWDPKEHPLKLVDDVWHITITPGSGVHQYMLWVDGDICPPPQCTRWMDDGFGGKNCMTLFDQP